VAEPLKAGPAAEPSARFLRACRRLPVDATPVWFMRQAGRYMPEYRAIRKKLSLLEIVARPEVAAEVTLQPVHRLGVDAAILFADILLPLVPMGLKLEYVQGEGPQISNPVRTPEQAAGLKQLDARSELGHVMETIRILHRELPEQVPLIGFAGAPFTVASYMVEGGPSKDHRNVKGFMYRHPEAWHAMMHTLAAGTADYLAAQIEAGAQAVQLFDSWVGVLSPADYERFALPYSRQVLQAAARQGVPVIHFGTNTAPLLPLMKSAGGSVMGLDWRVRLDKAWVQLGPDWAVQGNLDPALLFAPPKELEQQVRRVLDAAGRLKGHIFNVGHGIMTHTPVETVRALVDMVHTWTR
jgi:uroporphyrinogen decarboxylase